MEKIESPLYLVWFHVGMVGGWITSIQWAMWAAQIGWKLWKSDQDGEGNFEAERMEPGEVTPTRRNVRRKKAIKVIRRRRS